MNCFKHSSEEAFFLTINLARVDREPSFCKKSILHVRACTKRILSTEPSLRENCKLLAP